jgi:hypothetical protein
MFCPLYMVTKYQQQKEITFKVDVFHPEVFIIYIQYNVSVNVSPTLTIILLYNKEILHMAVLLLTLWR